MSHLVSFCSRESRSKLSEKRHRVCCWANSKYGGSSLSLLHHYYTSDSRCDKKYEIEVKLTKNKKSIYNIEYVLVGDYYIPDLKLPPEERPIGKYVRMHREYLKEHNPMMFNDLVLTASSGLTLPDFIFDGIRLSISTSSIPYVGKKQKSSLKRVDIFADGVVYYIIN